MPTVTGFSASAQLGRNRTGLNKTNNSTSPCTVTGTGLASTMAVNATLNQYISWTGTLTENNGTYTASLTCTNSTPKDAPPGGTDDVSVTVGSGNDVSPVFDANVDVGA